MEDGYYILGNNVQPLRVTISTDMKVSEQL